MKFSRPPFIAFALGVLAVGGFAPFGLFPLTHLSLFGLFLLWQRQPEKAPLLGWAWGFGLLLAGVSWIHVSMHQYGGMAAPLSLLATVLFAAVMALYYLLGGWLYRRLAGAGGFHWMLGATLAAACFTLADWTRGWFLTGFPWLAAGYSQTPPSPLAGFAPLFGVYGLTLLLALAAALFAFAWGNKARLRLAGAALVLLLVAGAVLQRVSWTTPRPTELEVSLLQGNIEQGLKWQPEHRALSLNTYLKLAQENPARLTVLPETALPSLLENLPATYLGDLLAASSRGGAADLILGAILLDRENHIYNAAISLGEAPVQKYAKHHLVPFGEFIPPLFKWTLALLSIPMSDQSRGPEIQPAMQIAGERIAVNICFEDVFGEELIRALPEAGILLNLSNTAWFGDSFAQPQHLQIARIRALETGRPMLRATNTGMTAHITPDGQVRAVLPPFSVGALKVKVQAHEGLTPYARWGNWPVVALCLAVLGFALWHRRKTAPETGEFQESL